MIALDDDKIKDLIPLAKGSDFKVGGYFYLKEEDGFHLCRITEWEMKSRRYYVLKVMTTQYIKEGKIFVRINNPWGSFE